MCIYVTFVVNPIERITRERIGRVETRRDLFFSQAWKRSRIRARVRRKRTRWYRLIRSSFEEENTTIDRICVKLCIKPASSLFDEFYIRVSEGINRKMRRSFVVTWVVYRPRSRLSIDSEFFLEEGKTREKRILTYISSRTRTIYRFFFFFFFLMSESRKNCKENFAFHRDRNIFFRKSIGTRS